jgi:hypothetical protein
LEGSAANAAISSRGRFMWILVWTSTVTPGVPHGLIVWFERHLLARRRWCAVKRKETSHPTPPRWSYTLPIGEV